MTGRIRKWNRKTILIVGASIVFIALYAFFLPLPFLSGNESRSAVWLECNYCYALSAPGTDTLYFKEPGEDSTFVNLSQTRANAQTTVKGSGFWYSPSILIHHSQGRILTSEAVIEPDTLTTIMQRRLHEWLEVNVKKAELRVQDNQAFDKNAQYYIDTHDVLDEGYNQIADVVNAHRTKIAKYAKTVTTLKRIQASPDAKITRITEITYRYVTKSGKLSARALPCVFVKSYPQSPVVMLQAANKEIPSECVSLAYPLVNFMSLTSVEQKKNAYLCALNVAVTTDSIFKQPIVPIQGRAWKEKGKTHYATSLPLLPCAVGAPIVDQRGVLIGIADKTQIIPFP